jgi:hypothetical protein
VRTGASGTTDAMTTARTFDHATSRPHPPVLSRWLQTPIDDAEQRQQATLPNIVNTHFWIIDQSMVILVTLSIKK